MSTVINSGAFSLLLGRTGLAVLLAMLLSSCAIAPEPAPVQSPEAGQARVAERQSRWADAAQLWAQAALSEAGISGPDEVAQGRYWVNSANAWLMASQPEKALEALDKARTSSLNRENSARTALLQAELALLAGDPDAAEFYLQAATNDLPGEWSSRLQSAQTELALMRQDPAARTLSEISEQVQSMPGYSTIAGLRILRSLERVSSDRVAEESEKPTLLAPWATLALAVRNTLLTRADLLQASEEWATSNPGHPVSAENFMELVWQYGQYFSPPEKIAVLLPTQGGLAAAGDAIRDGLISAFLEHPTGSTLDFLAFDDTTEAAVEAYQLAIDSGYQWVIGPLSQDNVQRLVDNGSGAVPALLLNWPAQLPEIAIGAQNPWFSLALSQQAESEAVALKMLELGHRRAIVLLTEGAWGDRTERAFIDQYQSGGGEVIALERFDARDADHSLKLTQLLLIEESRERRRRLQSALRISLEFEPSRRDDFEAIFFAGDAQLGRQLKPQLKFFDAGKKPVFAMSRVFSGSANTNRDQDLNGMIIPGTRWALSGTSANPGESDGLQLESLREGRFGSLHALGRDAWNLLPWLRWMERDPEFVFPGATGDLTATESGQIKRDPYWLQFQRGRLVALPDSRGTE